MVWLEENRSQLSVLVHPLTEDEYLDHTSSAVWLGLPLELELSIFTKNKKRAKTHADKSECNYSFNIAITLFSQS